MGVRRRVVMNKLVKDELTRIAEKWYTLRCEFGIEGNPDNDWGIAMDLFHRGKRRDEQIEKWFHGLYHGRIRNGSF